jgi:hypothetical protein
VLGGLWSIGSLDVKEPPRVALRFRVERRICHELRVSDHAPLVAADSQTSASTASASYLTDTDKRQARDVLQPHDALFVSEWIVAGPIL